MEGKNSGLLTETKEDGTSGLSLGRLLALLVTLAALFIWVHSYWKKGECAEVSDYHFYLILTLLAYNFGKKTSLTPFFNKGGKAEMILPIGVQEQEKGPRNELT